MNADSPAVTVLVPILTAFVTAAVGVVGLLFQDRVSRSRSGRRKLLYEEATQRVTFAAEWWQARQAIDSTPEELNEAAVRTLAWLNEASELANARDDPAISLRRLLLFERFERRKAKILRVGYYLFLIVMLYVSAAAAGSAAHGATTEQNIWDFAYVGLFGVVALALRSSAVAADNT